MAQVLSEGSKALDYNTRRLLESKAVHLFTNKKFYRIGPAILLYKILCPGPNVIKLFMDINYVCLQ
jgi:hypothetical protein